MLNSGCHLECHYKGATWSATWGATWSSSWGAACSATRGATWRAITIPLCRLECHWSITCNTIGDATWIYIFPGCVLALARLNVCKDKNNKTIIAHWAFDFMDGNIVACIYVLAACLYKTTCKLGVRHLCKSVGEGEVQRGGTKDMGKRGTWNSGMQAQNGMSV